MASEYVLLVGNILPMVGEALAARATVLRPDDAGNFDQVLATHGQKISAIATGAHAKVDATMMQRCPNLRIVANFGVGYDSVDAAWAGKHGIVVTNTPDVLTEEVADTTLGLLLMTVRELPAAERYLRAGNWETKGPYRLTPHSLRDRSVGILGLGRIGKAIARRCEVFGLTVSYHGRSRQSGVTYPFYPTLTGLADAVDTLIVVTPGGDGTQNLVNADVLKALGPRGIVINIARGTVIDETALIAALSDGTIAAAGLDVFEREPHVPQALLDLPNAVLLPHVGSASVHTRNAMGQLVVDNVIAFLEGKPPLTPVAETPFKTW